MYRFRVTVESLPTAGEPEKIQFEVENHDDILAIAKRATGKLGLEGDAAPAFVIGLKLFGETVLQNRALPLFAAIKPALGDFMKAMKEQIRATGTDQQ